MKKYRARFEGYRFPGEHNKLGLRGPTGPFDVEIYMDGGRTVGSIPKWRARIIPTLQRLGSKSWKESNLDVAMSEVADFFERKISGWDAQ